MTEFWHNFFVVAGYAGAVLGVVTSAIMTASFLDPDALDKPSWAVVSIMGFIAFLALIWAMATSGVSTI